MDRGISFLTRLSKIIFSSKKPVLNAKSISVQGKFNSKSRYQYWFKAMTLTHLRIVRLGQVQYGRFVNWVKLITQKKLWKFSQPPAYKKKFIESL